MTQVARLLRVILTGATLFSARALAQGGPPFRSDDPGTPGNKHWEINMGFVGARNPSEGSYAVPNIDFNYGLGNRIQLKYELPFSIQESRGESGHVVSGLGNSLLGLKYRLYEHRPKTDAVDAEARFAFSIYPQAVLSSPTGRDIVAPGPQLLLPMEASARLGPIRVSADAGYWFTTKDVPNSWIRGLIFGHEFSKKTELYLELYDQADVRGTGNKPKSRASTIGIGGRQAIVRDGSIQFIGMVGRSLIPVTPANGQPNWIAYLGLRVLLRSQGKTRK